LFKELAKMIQIRAAQPSDLLAIKQVTERAFTKSILGHHGEAELVDAIASNQSEAISLVAIHCGQVIGQLISSPATVEASGTFIHGAAIGPVSVDPDHQRQGVGSALIKNLIEISIIQRASFVAVAGHPDYYPRFGFQPLRELGIRHCFKGMRDEIFFIRPHSALERESLVGGVLRYCAQFGPQDRLA
jgi:putative acetyltransferase